MQKIGNFQFSLFIFDLIFMRKTINKTPLNYFYNLSSVIILLSRVSEILIGINIWIITYVFVTDCTKQL